MISIKKLSVSYNKKKEVIRNLNLSLKEGNIHGIVGLNGSGKTTLLNTIYGLKKHSVGQIMLKNNNISKKQIAYLVSENFFYVNITGREYLNIFKNKSFDLEKWNELFLLPLDDLIDNYSTGMKKKLAVLGILKQDKPIIILDEPFNGLDIETVRALRSLILKLKEKGKTIIITSHIIETLTNVCDYIHYLQEGKISMSKNKSEFVDFEKDIFEQIESKNEKIISELFS